MGYLKEKILENTPKEESISITIQSQKAKPKELTIQEKAEKLTDKEVQNAISEMKCAICGNKLNAYCYAEDDFAIECIDCDILYRE